MNVHHTLKMIAEKIKDIFPKMEEANSGTDYQKQIIRSIISHIQQRFAEIYGIIQREISNDDLDLTYEEAAAKYPQRLDTITTLISVVALAIKTKLNIPEFKNSYNNDRLKAIDKVCLECYKVKVTLSGKADPNANERYSHGVISKLSYRDYKTGYSKSMSPGLIPGQLMGIPICTSETLSIYSTMITHSREELDQQSKVATFEDRVYFSSKSSNCAPSTNIEELRNPKTLFQLSANLLIKNRSVFFKELEKLPIAVTEKLPELDVNYKHKFSLKIKKILRGINFKPTDQEKVYINKLLSASNENNPFNAIHVVVQEIDKIKKQAHLSIFKDHMQPIRDEIVRLMKEYNNDKEEYMKHFGKAL